MVVSCVPGKAFSPSPMAGFRKAFRQEVKGSLKSVSCFKLGLPQAHIRVHKTTNDCLSIQLHYLNKLFSACMNAVLRADVGNSCSGSVQFSPLALM